jgi:hypothetical protein
MFPFGKKEKKNGAEHSSNSSTAETAAIESLPTAQTKILGRVQIYGNEPHTFVGIVDQNGTEYAVYPSSQEEELRKLQGYLIEFTVVFLDEEEPQSYGGLFLKGGTVTPVTWEILS